MPDADTPASPDDLVTPATDGAIELSETELAQAAGGAAPAEDGWKLKLK